MKKANVVSVGLGFRKCGGRSTGRKCIVVGVSRKIPKSLLDPKDLVPDYADVVEIGDIRALGQSPVRPAPGGVSIGHYRITAGTFGCVVKSGGERVILSNNHILANSNEAEIGDRIYQPAPSDGGAEQDTIAHLLRYEPLVFRDNLPDCPIGRVASLVANWLSKLFGSRTRLASYREDAIEEGAANSIDAAIARPLEDSQILDEIVQIGKPTGILSEVSLGTTLQKYGRTTGYTTAEVEQVNVTVRVGYGGNRSALFENQIITGAMSAGGDSGSAVLDMDNNLVGLLFAGSNTSTILNPMVRVFEILNLTL